MVNFWKNNKLIIIFILGIISILYIFMVKVYAYEDYEKIILEDTGSDSADSLFTENVESDLKSIKNLLLNIQEVNQNTQDILQDSKSIQGQISDQMGEENEISGDTGNISSDTEDGDIQSDNEKFNGGTSGSEFVAEDDNQDEVGTDQPADETDEADYQSEVINSLNTIHNDNLKIMLSLWALTGLTLGTKLISRMFGNG